MPAKSELDELAAQLSVDAIRASTRAGSGHPTSALSASHLMAVLYANHLRWDPDDPDNLGGDRVIFSKGHATPLLYALLKSVGAITDDQLLTYRKFGSPLQGHPIPTEDMPWVDVGTGALGQGLPIGFGMAMGMRLRQLPGRVWVLMGDSEMAEGSVWEAMENASHHGLRNLVGILDMNRLGQRGPTMLEWDGDTYARRAEAFGWEAIQVDGHDVDDIDAAYGQVAETDRPVLIVAKTVKGHGVSFLADRDGWHGKALSEEEAATAVEELGGERSLTIKPAPPQPVPDDGDSPEEYSRPTFTEPLATRRAFGKALAALAHSRSDLVVIDGEVANSTYTEFFQKEAPDRFIEVFIAEQLMVGAAVGLQVIGLTPVAATFGAFLTRAYDFIRMAAVSGAHMVLAGSHAGVSIGQDGASQMALEDFSMMRSIHGSTVLSPADATSTVRLVEAALDWPGISFIRTIREDTPVLYGSEDEFPIGGSKVIRHDEDDRATLVATGITVFQALAAADQLAEEGITVGVIDCYSIKPIDGETLRGAVMPLVVVEDHWAEGGLGDAVLAALAEDELSGRVIHLAVTEMPRSGAPDELRDAAGISSPRIVEVVRRALA